MFNNKFLKKDPLVEAVMKAQADGDMRRKAIATVNEQFGVYSRNAVIRENLAAYDAAVESAYTDLKEGKKLADKDYDKDGKVESPKDEVWGSRLRAAKMAGKLEEGNRENKEKKKEHEEKTGFAHIKKMGGFPGQSLKRTARSLNKEETDYSAQDRAPVTKSAPKEDPSLPSSYPGAASSAPTAARLSNAKAAVTPVKEALKLTPSAPKEFKEKRHPNPNAVTKAPVPGVSIAEKTYTSNLQAPQDVDEAAYSAKAGRAGKDLGKPGKNFSKIAAKSGGGEKGNRIAGAILKKIRAKHMKEDSSFNSAQVTGKSVNEVALDMPAPPTSAYHAPAKPGNPAAQVKLRAPTGMQGARQVSNGVRPSSVNFGNIKPSMSYGMSQSGQQAASVKSTVPRPPITAGPRAGVGGLGGATGAGIARGLAGTVARGAVGAAVTAAAPVLGKAMQQSHQSGHSATPGVSAHPSTPDVSAQKSFSAMRKIEAPNAKPAAPTKELNPSTTGTPAKMGAYNSSVGPDATKFTGGAKPAAAPVKQSFSQAYQAARSAAGSKANFTWGGKSFQAAAKKSEYVAPSKQIKTDTATNVPPPAAPAPKDVPTIKAPSTPAKVAPPPVTKPEPAPTVQSPDANPAPAPKATAPSWADQEKAIKNTPAPSTYVPDAAKVGRTDSDVAPKSAPAPEKSGSEKEGEKKMKSLGLDESVISVGANKYRII